MIYGMTTDMITVGQFSLSVILRNVDNQIDSVITDYIKNRLSFFVRPAYLSGFHAVFSKECSCAE